jgi:hypothetical protein
MFSKIGLRVVLNIFFQANEINDLVHATTNGVHVHEVISLDFE